MKKDRINNIFMLIMFFCFLAYGMVALIRTPKEISYTENRNLNKFQQFTLKGFLDGTYQTSLENAFTDQFVGGGSIKELMNRNLNFSKKLLSFPPLCRNRYISIGAGYYTYDCSKMIVDYHYADLIDEDAFFEKTGTEYSKLHDLANFNYYYITTPANFDLYNKTMPVNVPEYINKYWTGKYKFETLEVKNKNDLEKFFYKTDHHWNHVGSYEGYKEIIKMLKPKVTPIEPIREKEFEVNFYGSRARVTSFYDYAEKFTVYEYSFPEFEIYINGEKSNYGKEKEYLKGEYSKEQSTNHYGIYYGGDYPELVFKNKTSKGGNILILGNSFTNAINKMIAKEYEETYIVDLRHYEGHYGRRFDIETYIKQNEIDDVLIVMDWWFITSAGFDMWGDK